MPTTTRTDTEYLTHEIITVLCQSCSERIGWVECPTGGWWKHFDHPPNGHDAHPDALDLCAQVYRLTCLVDWREQEISVLQDEITSMEYYGA